MLIEALTKAVFCIFRPKYLLLILYFITVTVGVFLFALSFELYIHIYIAQKLIFFMICYKRENIDSELVIFSQTRIKNRVTMATD